jgi:hypothetical protein
MKRASEIDDSSAAVELREPNRDRFRGRPNAEDQQFVRANR